MSLDARSAIVRELAKKMKQTERSRTHSSNGQPDDLSNFADIEAFENRQRDATVSTGLTALDAILPDAGFLKGTIVEWVCDETGSGAQTLAMISAAKILNHRPAFSTFAETEKVNAKGNKGNKGNKEQPAKNLLVVDAANDFHAVAASKLGIDLKHTVVVQPNRTSGQANQPSAGSGTRSFQKSSTAKRSNDVLWTLEQALRSKAIGLTMCVIDHLNGHTFRRLQLAVQAGGGLCFLRRPMAAIRQPTWADVRLQVKASQPSMPDRQLSDFNHQSVRRLTIKLLKCRAGLSGEQVEVDYHDETNVVRVAAELARPAAAHRAS